MKYPNINGKLDFINKKRFDYMKKEVFESLRFDNQENDLKIKKDTLEMLAWNITTRIISRPF